MQQMQWWITLQHRNLALVFLQKHLHVNWSYLQDFTTLSSVPLCQNDESSEVNKINAKNNLEFSTTDFEKLLTQFMLKSCMFIALYCQAA